MKKQLESRFVKVRCQKCKNEQNIFGKASSVVKCLICGEVLTEPRGGKCKIRGKVVEVLD